jgi:hypothetical protein
MKIISNSKLIALLIISSIFLSSCGIYKPVDARKIPGQAKDRARQNIDEGRGVSIGSVINRGRGGGSFEFSSSNPMWRASLEIIDFLPLTTVDYSGGIIITDWYSDNQKTNEFIKITIRFLSNEIRADSVKILVHNKKCSNQNNCQVSELKSEISNELSSSIIKRAALIEKTSKKKK